MPSEENDNDEGDEGDVDGELEDRWRDDMRDMSAAGCVVKIAEVFLTSTNNVAKNVRVLTSAVGY